MICVDWSPCGCLPCRRYDASCAVPVLHVHEGPFLDVIIANTVFPAWFMRACPEWLQE